MGVVGHIFAGVMGAESVQGRKEFGEEILEKREMPEQTFLGKEDGVCAGAGVESVHEAWNGPHEGVGSDCSGGVAAFFEEFSERRMGGLHAILPDLGEPECAVDVGGKALGISGSEEAGHGGQCPGSESIGVVE